MFLVVGDQIVQRKPVVAIYEIDALLGPALLVCIKLLAAEQTIRNTGDRIIFAAEEVAYIVSEFSIPLSPAIPNKTADLVKTGGVPSLRNHLDAGERRIGFNV